MGVEDPAAGEHGEPEAGDGQAGLLPEAGKERRIILFGDSDFASNAYLHLSGNTNLFLNSIAWLADESELISIRSTRKLPQPVTLACSRSRDEPRRPYRATSRPFG